MGVVIDSSILIAAERGAFDLRAEVNKRSEEEFFISAISASEMLHGLHRAATPEQRSRRQLFLESILSSFPVIPFDLRAARVHARLSAELAVNGITVGAHDLLIGATALAMDCQLATRDARSFFQIPGLSVQRW